MASQTTLTTRRQFLNRSAWGFGSAFILPSLLQSCMRDHIIPDPSNPVNPPKLGDGFEDLNNDTKIAITTALQLVPDVGGFVSALIDIIWPGSGNGPWDTVRSQVEALVDQKLADDDYNRVTGNLAGLSTVIENYKTQVKLNADIKTYWIDAYDDFDLYQPNFQQKNDEVLLLPLFAQFANLYLSLLRDAVKFGASWGMTDGEIQTYATKLTDKINEFTTYANTWYTNGRAPKLQIPRDDAKVEPFRSTNAYDRYMTMGVLDFMDAWPYYDLTKYPNGSQNSDGTNIPLFTREIYSDPFGNRVNVDKYPPNFALPSEATQFPTQLTVWGNKDIGAVQLTYPAGGGPGGATTTPRMGDQTSGNPNTFYPSANQPIQLASVSYDYTRENTSTMVINTLQFTLSYDGNTPNRTPQLGQALGQFKVDVWYLNYALSSIYIDGVDDTLQQYANCIVFGFKRFPQ